jgi:hypothetical protein
MREIKDEEMKLKSEQQAEQAKIERILFTVIIDKQDFIDTLDKLLRLKGYYGRKAY